MRRSLMALSLLAGLTLASHAQADDAVDPSSRAGAEPATRWYGWQTLTADALTVTTFVLAGELDSPALAWMGLGTFLLAPPIIHMAHQSWLEAGVSLSVRAGSVALVVAGVAIALSDFDLSADADSSSSDEAAAILLSVLGLAGMAAAPVVDALIAKEPVEDQASAWTVAPWVSPRARGGGLVASARW